MSVALALRSVGKISWKLRECMARRRVKNADLAKAIGVHPTSIARLKTPDVLPEIGNTRVEEIRKAISDLSRSRYGECLMEELVEVLND